MEELPDDYFDRLREAGVVSAKPQYAAEHARWEALNRQYWELRVAGDKRYEDIEADPLWRQYSRGIGTISMFWNMYSDLPPGWAARAVREHPVLLSLLRNREDGYASPGSVRQFQDGIRIIEGWLRDPEIQAQMRDVGMDPSEYEEARALMTQYWELPKEERKAFLEANPLLAKYMIEPDDGEAAKEKGTTVSRGGSTSGGASRGGYSGPSYGGSRSSGPQVNSGVVWQSFSRRMGGSLQQVVGHLAKYWNTGEMSDGVRTYLEKLHKELGGSMSFEEWLQVLRKGYVGTLGDVSVGTPKAPPKARYGGNSGGGIIGRRSI